MKNGGHASGKLTSYGPHLEVRNDDTITPARIGIEVGERNRVNEGRHHSSNPPKIGEMTDQMKVG